MNCGFIVTVGARFRWLMIGYRLGYQRSCDTNHRYNNGYHQCSIVASGTVIYSTNLLEDVSRLHARREQLLPVTCASVDEVARRLPRHGHDVVDSVLVDEVLRRLHPHHRLVILLRQRRLPTLVRIRERLFCMPSRTSNAQHNYVTMTQRKSTHVIKQTQSND